MKFKSVDEVALRASVAIVEMDGDGMKSWKKCA